MLLLFMLLSILLFTYVDIFIINIIVKAAYKTLLSNDFIVNIIIHSFEHVILN